MSADVCLVTLPYATVERPSPALGIFKAGLSLAGIRSQTVYANFDFAEEVGLDLYHGIISTLNDQLLGEWTFSEAAFPGFKGDAEAYFVEVRESVLALEALTGRTDIPAALAGVRARAAGFVDQTVLEVLKSRPRIVACTSMFQQQCATLAFLRRIRELAPAIVTVVGGSNCVGTMGMVMHREFPWIDFIVSGEADLIFPRLCADLLARGRDLPAVDLPEGVMGPSHRLEPERFRRQWSARPPWAILEDINAVPVPDYRDYFRRLRRSSLAARIRPGLLIETSRGCWWGEKKHCAFCGLNGPQLGYRRKDPAISLAEMERLARRHRIRKFWAVDNIMDHRYLKTLFPMLKARRGKRFELLYECKANLRREQVHLLADSGTRWIQPGIESLDDGLLRSLGKGVTVMQNLETLKWARECGLHALWLLLYDIPGQPDEPFHRMSRWLPLISHLQPPKGMSCIRFDRFSPYQQNPEKFGLHLRPAPAYAHVYPLPERTLADFAYFFEHYIDGQPRRTRFGARDQITPPGATALRDAVARWQEEWLGRYYPEMRAPFPASLAMLDREGALTFFDTRRCALEFKCAFDGRARALYLLCEHARRRDDLPALFGEQEGRAVTAEEIESLIAEFVRRRLMLDLDGWILSLALPWPIRSCPRFAEAPGGQIETRMEHDLKQRWQATVQAYSEAHPQGIFL